MCGIWRLKKEEEFLEVYRLLSWCVTLLVFRTVSFHMELVYVQECHNRGSSVCVVYVKNKIIEVVHYV